MSCLKILLSINEGRELILKYATKHMNSELIRFIIDLEKFKKNNSVERFMALIQDYIMKDSVFELNIPYDMKHRMHIDANANEFSEIELHVKMLINQHLLTEDFVSFIEKHYEEQEKDKKPAIFNIFRRGSIKNL